MILHNMIFELWKLICQFFASRQYVINTIVEKIIQISIDFIERSIKIQETKKTLLFEFFLKKKEAMKRIG